ncbi:MAG: glycosyltransferase family 4 protein [Mycobacteriales bacterium]
MKQPEVVIVHDYLTQRGGAERVVLSMCKAFPGARLLTSIYNPETTYPEFKDLRVETSALNANPVFRHDPRLAFPLLAGVFRRWEVSADVVLASSSGWAHGISTNAPKVVYCYNPPRWLYQREEYVRGLSSVGKVALASLSKRLQVNDKRRAAEAAHYVTLSSVVQKRIRAVYGRPSTIVAPPVVLSAEQPQEAVADIEPGYLLTISRPRSYKNVDVICQAIAERPNERLVVVGPLPRPPTGGRWTSNVISVGRVSDAGLRWIYQHCRAVVAASHEDFGLTPLEGNCFGKPAMVLQAGGFLDTLVPEQTGIFFDQVSVTSVLDGLDRLDAQVFDPVTIRKHGESYNEDVFISHIRQVVLGVMAGKDEAFLDHREIPGRAHIAERRTG